MDASTSDPDFRGGVWPDLRGFGQLVADDRFIAMREIWGWSSVKAGAIALVFLVVDCGFFTSNLTKVLEGGYVPLYATSLGLARSKKPLSSRVRPYTQTSCHIVSTDKVERTAPGRACCR